MLAEHRLLVCLVWLLVPCEVFFMTSEFESRHAHTVEEAHAPAIARGARCAECPLYGCQRGPVMGVIRPNTRLALVGEAPGCFPAGTPVLTPSGFVSIEQLHASDTVIAGDGNPAVVRNVFTRKFEGSLVAIKALGGWSIDVTPNHQVWAYDLPRSKTSHSRRTIGNPRWLPAAELTCEHAILAPTPSPPEMPTHFDLSSYNILRRSANFASNNVPDALPLTCDVAYVMGLFMGDGNARSDSGTVTWHLSKGYKERHIPRLTSILVDSFGVEASVSYSLGKSITIRASSTKLARFFRSEFGSRAVNKFVPRQLFYAPNEVITQFLYGWYVTDGNHIKNLNKARNICTVSRNAALGAYALLLRAGVYPGFRVEPPTPSGKGGNFPCYKIEFRNSDVKRLGLDIETHDKKPRELHTYSSEGIIVPVTSVNRREWSGIVHNIETCTNDYCVPFKVHNSNEVEEGTPFIGASGRVLNESLAAGGVKREDCTITNALLCQPEPDFGSYMELLRRRGTKVLPTEACFPRLKRDLDESNATVDLAVGKQALAAIAKYHGVPHGKEAKIDTGQTRIASMRKQHGAPVVIHDKPRKLVMGTYHPAFAFRGSKEWMPVIKRELRRAASLAVRGGQIDWERPKYNIDPSIEDVERFAEMVVGAGVKVTLDIETGPSAPGLTDGADVRRCTLRCVGLGATMPDGSEHIIVVPFKNMDASLEWDGDAQLLGRAADAVRRICDTCTLVMQNGAFDTAVLLRLGLMSDRRRTYEDTMLAHRNTKSCDLPHDLGFITTEFFEAPHHKEDADHKTVNNVDYPRLKFYNADDILTTMRIWPEVENNINEVGTWPSYDMDVAIAPACRDMGDLGLVIDENERQRLAKELLAKRELHDTAFQYYVGLSRLPEDQAARAEQHHEGLPTNDARRKFRQEVVDRLGNAVNPNSPHQLKAWLFGELGLTPTLNTDQYDWEEEDEPSTSQGALIKLQSKGLDMPANNAVNCLFEYRAYNKLYGTYVADKHGRIKDYNWAQHGYEQYDWLRILNTTYKQHVIPSGRLSTQPAIQNWPALGKANMRTMVVSPPGHALVGADYDQLELRIYAVIAQDQLLLQAFDEGKDPHALNAASLLADHESQIWDLYERIVNAPSKKKKYWRTVAKRFAYLECYGGEEDKLFQTMSTSRDKGTGKLDFPNLTPDDVAVWHDRWHRLHPETRRWQQSCTRACRAHGYTGVCTLDYRKRFFPGGVSKKNAPINMTIQGFAASIANKALLELEAAIPHRGWSPVSGLCLQVHDYIGAYVPRERAWEAKNLLEEIMPYTYRGMTMTATADISYRWSEQG